VVVTVVVEGDLMAVFHLTQSDKKNHGYLWGLAGQHITEQKGRSKRPFCS